MIRIALIAVLAFGSMQLMGQGGSWYVGGIAGFSQSSSDENLNPKTTTWEFGPEVGTFFNEKWSAGIVLGLSGSSSKNDDGDLFESSMFMPNIYGRRWWSAGDKLGIFAGLDVNFGSGSTTTFGEEEVKTEMTAFGSNLNVGVAYALAQRWTLLMKFAALGYGSETEKGQDGAPDVTDTNFGLVADGNITTDQFIFVGLYWNFIQPSE